MPCSKVCMFTYCICIIIFFTVAVDWCNIPGLQKKNPSTSFHQCPICIGILHAGSLFEALGTAQSLSGIVPNACVRPRVLLKDFVNILWYFQVHIQDDVQRSQIRNWVANLLQSSNYTDSLGVIGLLVCQFVSLFVDTKMSS